jgi:hypothetical protein
MPSMQHLFLFLTALYCDMFHIQTYYSRNRMQYTQMKIIVLTLDDLTQLVKVTDKHLDSFIFIYVFNTHMLDSY